MNVFITGTTGFVGARLVNSIQDKIKILSRKKNSNYDTVVCDLRIDQIPLNALKGVDVVFHLAGFAHDMRDASKIADLYYKVNVNATVQLANLAVSPVLRGLYLLVVSRQVGVHLLQYARMRRIREMQKMFTEKRNVRQN